MQDIDDELVSARTGPAGRAAKHLVENHALEGSLTVRRIKGWETHSGIAVVAVPITRCQSVKITIFPTIICWFASDHHE